LEKTTFPEKSTSITGFGFNCGKEARCFICSSTSLSSVTSLYVTTTPSMRLSEVRYGRTARTYHALFIAISFFTGASCSSTAWASAMRSGPRFSFYISMIGLSMSPGRSFISFDIAGVKRLILNSWSRNTVGISVLARKLCRSLFVTSCSSTLD
jgi:hypothetical protein